MEQTIRCQYFCNRDELRLFRRYHYARLLGIHHEVTSVNVFSNAFYTSKQHLLNFGRQRALLHSN